MEAQDKPSSASLSLPAAASSSSSAQRVLACVLCQQRKVKCDRKFPCGNCARACVKCVPASSNMRQRRRRFPESELLARLRCYESLLRENNIQFEPLHASNDGGKGSDYPVGRTPIEKKAVNSETEYKAKNFWNAMNQRPTGPDNSNDNDDNEDGDDEVNDGVLSRDEVRETVVKKVWDQWFQSNDHFLFGSRKSNIDLSTLHPKQVQIFKLWQIYLDNVDPLLKVTHTPTLQARIIDAVSDVANIDPNLEVLMFSIYCISILSLEEEECSSLFGSPKEHLLTGYQFACQQALMNCAVLRSSNRDCLTALYLFLLSARTDTDPQSLSAMLGVAIRIAHRMGIHNEFNYAKCTAFEAEMRRRLWWSLVIYDDRICQMSDYKTTTLDPTWDCRIPLNVNDFDIRPEMKISPAAHEKPTETLFAVARDELAEFVRHSSSHLDFTNPSLKSIAKETQHGLVPEDDGLTTLEKMMEEKYLQFCNPENPLHFMTIWTVRGSLAKIRLLECYSRYARSTTEHTDTQRDEAISHALGMLECNTNITTSPLTKGYLWLANSYFPFTAYIHIVQDLKKRPSGKHTERTWEIMSDNYEAHSMYMEADRNLIFGLFSRFILYAWEACETAGRRSNKPIEPPRIVRDIKRKLAQMALISQSRNMEQSNGAIGANMDDFSLLLPMEFGGLDPQYGLGGQGFSDIMGQAAITIDANQLDWTLID